MLDALLKGKLSREQENMEDILTSIVFGTIKYMSPYVALFPFLAKAELSTMKKPLINLLSMTIAEVDYKFWDRLQECDKSCEPDVLISISFPNNHKFLVLIEAKYHSGKSSTRDETEKPNDQLAKEWINLKIRAQKQNAEPYLIYLTSDFGFPIEQINESQQELKEKGESEGVICWLSWRHFPLLDEIKGNRILEDIAKLLRNKMKLIFYEGITISNLILSIKWRYEKIFNWFIPPQNLKWKFKII